MTRSSRGGEPVEGRHQPDPLIPRWPTQVVLCLLLPVGILGALVLSASATIDKAAEHGVDPAQQPWSVAMLEVVAMAGTLLAIFGATRSTRRRGMTAVIVACAVTSVAGWSAYGWFGLVGALGLVLLVHLAAETWRESRETTSPTTQTDSAADEAERDDESDDEPEREVESDDKPEPLPQVPGVQPHVVAQAVELLAREPAAGRPRVRTYLGITDHAAGKLLAALRPVRSVGAGEAS